MTMKLSIAGLILSTITTLSFASGVTDITIASNIKSNYPNMNLTGFSWTQTNNCAQSNWGIYSNTKIGLNPGIISFCSNKSSPAKYDVQAVYYKNNSFHYYPSDQSCNISRLNHTLEFMHKSHATLTLKLKNKFTHCQLS